MGYSEPDHSPLQSTRPEGRVVELESFDVMSQPRFPSIFRIESIWFWHELELESIARELGVRLGLADHFRDYEDTWEWVDISLGDGSFFNLCRMHNWQSGVYSDPVVIKLQGTTKLDEPALRKLADVVKQAFGCQVFGGDIGHSKNGEIRIYDSIEL